MHPLKSNIGYLFKNKWQTFIEQMKAIHPSYSLKEIFGVQINQVRIGVEEFTLVAFQNASRKFFD